VARLVDAGSHARRANRLGDAEVEVEAVRDAATVGDESAGAPHAPDKALAFERAQRFAKSRARNAELGRQLRFGRKARADRQDAPVNALRQLVADARRARRRVGGRHLEPKYVV
jgi:hypothetical protein